MARRSRVDEQPTHILVVDKLMERQSETSRIKMMFYNIYIIISSSILVYTF